MTAQTAHAPAFDEHWIARGDAKLYARDYGGQGPGFVMMHGFPDNLHIYDDLAPFLVAGGRRVVTFDFLGSGRSDKPVGALYSFQQQREDLEAVVAALELGTVVPVAHDSSGPAAINFALEHPDKTAWVCILNAAYDPSPNLKLPEFIELFATPTLKALSSALLRSPEHFAWVLNFQRARFQESLAEDHRARYAAFLGPIIDANFRNQPSSAPAFGQMTGELFDEVGRNGNRYAQLAALKPPVRLIWGQNDPYLDVDLAKDLQSRFKGAELDLLPAGHWVQIDEPAKSPL